MVLDLICALCSVLTAIIIIIQIPQIYRNKITHTFKELVNLNCPLGVTIVWIYVYDKDEWTWKCHMTYNTLQMVYTQC